MRKIIFSVVFLLVAGAVFGQEFTFRGLPWGSTAQQIIAKEGRPDKITENVILEYHNVYLFGYHAPLVFYLNERKRLCWGRYHIQQTSPKNKIQDVFADMLNKLTALYGKPTKEITTGNKEEYYWIVSRSKITISMSTQFGWSVALTYECPELNDFSDL